MRFCSLGPDHGVLEIDHGSPFPTAGVGGLGLELRVWWGGDEPTRAAWIWRETGKVAGWAEVGEA
jgi:hypothetical protein